MEPLQPLHNQPLHNQHDALNLKKFYHFLMTFSVMQLRRVAKVWGRRQHGLKKTIVARLFLYVFDRVQDSRHALTEVLATNSHLDPFQPWLSENRLQVEWDDPPSRPELLTIIDAASPSPTDSPNYLHHETLPRTLPESIPPPCDLSLSEFARLFLLIKENLQIKRAIFESRRELLREEHATDRFNFWSTLVEPRFHDNSFTPTLDVDPSFEGVDPARIPPVHRNGAELMHAFAAARQSFLVYLERWLRGGSGIPALFEDVLPRNGRGGSISRTGKRSLMLFKIVQCWDDNQDALMLGLSSKFTAGGTMRGMRSSNAGGIAAKCGDEDDDTDFGSEIQSTGRSKRRRQTSDAGYDSPDIEEYTKEVLHAMKRIAAGKCIETKRVQESERDEEGYARDVRIKRLRVQMDLMGCMGQARRIMREHQDDDELRGMAELFYEELKAEYMSVRT